MFLGARLNNSLTAWSTHLGTALYGRVRSEFRKVNCHQISSITSTCHKFNSGHNNKIHCFTGHFLPKICVQLFIVYFYQLVTFVPSIHACSKRAASAFCLCLQTFGLVLQARRSLFPSTDCFQYSYLISDRCCHGNRHGLQNKPVLQINKKEAKVGKISALKTMSDNVQKMPKQQNTQRKCCKFSQNTKP